MKEIKIKNFDSHKISDSDVVRRVLAGEKELYEILLRRNNQKLYRVIRSYIKEQDEVQDVMQDTYLKAYEKLDQYRHHSQFSTWLIRIGINEALAKIKSKGKLINLHGHSEDAQDTVILQIEDKSIPNPEKKIIKEETKQMIENAIDKLEEKYRAVYMLKEIEGMGISDIAECLDLSESNVKVRLHRAKSMIKEMLYEISIDRQVFEFGFSRCDNMVESVMKKII